jgi:hypothetical protein
MMEKFRFKVALARVAFIVIVVMCLILYRYNLSDYALVVSFVTVCLGIFSISAVDISNRAITIQKSYFWGLFRMKKILDVRDLVSIRTNTYTFDLPHDAGVHTDSVLDAVASNTLAVTTVLCYKEDGIIKSVRLEISRDTYRDIDRRIKPT